MKSYLTISLLALAFTGCKAQQPATNPVDSLPGWLSTKITQFETGNSSAKGKVEAYTYHQETVYLADFCVGCPDNLVYVYSAEGEVVCQFGGFAGTNTCPDFSKVAVLKGIIWPKD